MPERIFCGLEMMHWSDHAYLCLVLGDICRLVLCLGLCLGLIFCLILSRNVSGEHEHDWEQLSLIANASQLHSPSSHIS